LNLSELLIGQKAIITDVSSLLIPLKLLEMGCLPGNEVELLHVAPLADPLYLNMNGTHLAIRKELANHILITLSNG